MVKRDPPEWHVGLSESVCFYLEPVIICSLAAFYAGLLMSLFLLPGFPDALLVCPNGFEVHNTSINTDYRIAVVVCVPKLTNGQVLVGDSGSTPVNGMLKGTGGVIKMMALSGVDHNTEQILRTGGANVPLVNTETPTATVFTSTAGTIEILDNGITFSIPQPPPASMPPLSGYGEKITITPSGPDPHTGQIVPAKVTLTGTGVHAGPGKQAVPMTTGAGSVTLELPEKTWVDENGRIHAEAHLVWTSAVDVLGETMYQLVLSYVNLFSVCWNLLHWTAFAWLGALDAILTADEPVVITLLAAALASRAMLTFMIYVTSHGSR